MNKFLILSYDYPPNDGGISRLCSAMVEDMRHRGSTVTVFTVHAGTVGGPLRPDVATVEMPSKRWLREVVTFLQVLRMCRDTCVVSTVWNPEGTLAYLAGFQQTVVMAHGNEVMNYPPGLRHRLKGWLRRKVITSASTVVCNSRYTERLVHAISPKTKTVVITPGVDTQRYAPVDDVRAIRQQFNLPTECRVVLSVSRIDAYKGHEVVLKALAQISPGLRGKLHYVVAGRGSHLTTLKALATSLGIEDSVTWLGFVPDDQLPALYNCADLFVLCTREDPQARGVEGFGMVFLEAQASGVPVIGTRAGGIPDAIEEGRGGWLIEQDDVSTLSLHLEMLSRDMAPFRAQGLLGRQRALTQCTWDLYVSKLLKVMDVENG